MIIGFIGNLATHNWTGAIALNILGFLAGEFFGDHLLLREKFGRADMSDFVKNYSVMSGCWSDMQKVGFLLAMGVIGILGITFVVIVDNWPRPLRRA